MVLLPKYAALVLALLCLELACCSFPVRTGYDRRIGDYKPVPAAETAAPKEVAEPETPAQESPKVDSTKRQNSVEKARAAVNKKEVAKAAQKSTPRGNLEN